MKKNAINWFNGNVHMERVSNTEGIKCNNIIKQYKLYFDDVTKKKHKRT